jgi:hypothetical protein
MDYKQAKRNIHEWTDEEFEILLRAGVSELAPSEGFEARFWKKVIERQKAPWTIRFFRDLESWIPAPNLSGAVASLVIAFLVGGVGGSTYTIRNAADGSEAQRASIRYLSGFQEFQGVPASSIAGTYLKTAEKGGEP